MKFCTEPSSIWRCIYITTAIQLGMVVSSLKTEGSIPTVASTNPGNYYMELSTPSKAEAVEKFISFYRIWNSTAVIVHVLLVHILSHMKPITTLQLYIIKIYSSSILPPTLCSTWSGFSGRGRLWIFPLTFATLSTCLPTKTPGFHHHKLWNLLLCNFMLSPLLPNILISFPFIQHHLFNP